MKQKQKLDGMLMSSMKSGSTWLAKMCQKHPDIFVCFGQKLKTTNQGIENIDWSGYAGEKITLGRRNIKIEEVYLQSYFKHNPDMKFVCLLRDPVTRAFSNYCHLIYKRVYQNHQIVPVSQSLFKIVFDFNKSVEEFFQKKDFTPEYLAKSFYFKCLEPYFHKFGKDHFLIMPFEQAVVDPSYLFQRISDFFKISHDSIEFSSKKVNITQNIKPRFSSIRRKVDIIPPTQKTNSLLASLFYSDSCQLFEEIGMSFPKEWEAYSSLKKKSN